MGEVEQDRYELYNGGKDLDYEQEALNAVWGSRQFGVDDADRNRALLEAQVWAILHAARVSSGQI